VTVSPAASTFAGFDVMAKRTSGGQFYIFSMPRYSKTLANQTATFTIKNTGSTRVTVINENRTIPVTNGTQFVDNFATANTVHIYRVD
jgi:archaellum component FlaG (FlaF/FlaG flagellin family)